MGRMRGTEQRVDKIIQIGYSSPFTIEDPKDSTPEERIRELFVCVLVCR